MKVANDTLIPGGPISLNADWTSEELDLSGIYLLSLQLTFTGSPTGTFHLEASNDRPVNGVETRHWTPIKRSYQAITEAGSHLWTFSDTSVRHIRVVYTFTSGTGSLTEVQYCGKGV